MFENSPINLSSATIAWVFAAFFAGVFSTIVVALLGRAAFAGLRPFARVLRGALRFLRWKSVARSRPARAALTGATAHRRADHLTAIECALRGQDLSEDGEVREYDFSEERRILRRHGGVYTWLRIPAEYIPASLAKPFTDAIASEYHAAAQGFFSRTVDLHADEQNLYEDEEGAVLVALFRNSDRRCFYALDRLRRSINGNARTLVSILSFLTLAAAAAAYSAAMRLLPAGAAISAESLVATLISGVAVLVVYGVVAYLVQLLYNNDQRQNMREFSDFLTRYLSLVSNRFREASANASRVIQGDERDSKRLSSNAQKWHKIMIWLGLRPFFIESFVRNVIFQIRRNSKYYVAGAVLLFFAFGPAVFVGTASALAAREVLGGLSAAGWAFVGVVYLICAFGGMAVINKPVIFDELNQTNWLGYDNLDVGRQMDEVIGKFAEEIGLWRGRFRE